jgi:hypothetical protein
MPDDHSEVVPLLPIPNRTVKRLCADDSADSRVKVGHRQALTATKPQQKCWGFCFFQNLFSNVQHVLPFALRGARAHQVVGELLYPGD